MCRSMPPLGGNDRMVSTIQRETEVAVRAANIPGAEDRVLSLVVERGVNVRATGTYRAGDRLIVLLVSDEPRLTKQALMSTGLDCKLNSVLMARLQNQTGALDQLAAELKAVGIEIIYSYTSHAGSEEIIAVFKTNDDAQ